MLKIKIFALLFALAMTLLTIYLIPIIYSAYMHWTDSLNPQQQQWFNYCQAILGILVALLALWHWKKSKRPSK